MSIFVWYFFVCVCASISYFFFYFTFLLFLTCFSSLLFCCFSFNVFLMRLINFLSTIKKIKSKTLCRYFSICDQRSDPPTQLHCTRHPQGPLREKLRCVRKAPSLKLHCAPRDQAFCYVFCSILSWCWPTLVQSCLYYARNLDLGHGYYYYCYIYFL